MSRPGAKPKNKPNNKICVYCSSSDAIAPEFFPPARELGEEIARRGQTLVYGGCSVGLMGEVARAAKQQGGRVIGVIPEHIHSRGLGYTACDELHVTPTMYERKARMEDLADAFIALPGGFGTLEEILQVINLKQLGYHSKPVVFINTQQFYDPLLLFFEHTYSLSFTKPAYRRLYHVAADVAGVFTYLESYREPLLGSKWFSTPAEAR